MDKNFVGLYLSRSNNKCSIDFCNGFLLSGQWNYLSSLIFLTHYAYKISRFFVISNARYYLKALASIASASGCFNFVCRNTLIVFWDIYIALLFVPLLTSSDERWSTGENNMYFRLRIRQDRTSRNISFEMAKECSINTLNNELTQIQHPIFFNYVQ